jgi:pimeloyl-ACP methyl ester carboxylesterase
VFHRHYLIQLSASLLYITSLKNSWRLGLKGTAWGDPEKLRDSDVLRYQWPSIGKGWERGLLEFARAQKSFDDKSLFRQVLNLPNTTVAVVLGSKDKVIPTRLTERFLSDFKDFDVEVVQLEGLGHNAFEEDVETFMSAVEKIVNKEK